MNITIYGPKKPEKAFVQLQVNSQKALVCEGLFDRFFVASIRLFFDPSKGYHNQNNKIIYDTIWQKVFNSLTGEQLEQCVTQSIFSDDDYLNAIKKIFGSIEDYKQIIGHHPLDVHGINLDGSWIISKDKKNLALLVDEFHEIGHRVYPISVDRYHRELGANYFMLLSFKKTNLELQFNGASIPPIDFGKQITEHHGSSLKEAQRLIDTNATYVHKVE